MRNTTNQPFHLNLLRSLNLRPGKPIAGSDVDDTCMYAMPNWRPDQTHDGVDYMLLCGELVPLNKGFKPCGDTLVNLRRAFGSHREEDGQLWGQIWDQRCKNPATPKDRLTFERHLKLQFEDIVGRRPPARHQIGGHRLTIEQAVEFAIKTMMPMPGFVDFLANTHDKLDFVFITNGADAIAQPVLNHFFGSVLGGKVNVVANLLENGVFRGLHGDVGVAKGEVVLSLENVQFFFGDSKGGDGPGAKAVWDDGGHVFAFGHDGESSLADYCSSHFGSTRWSYLDDYHTATAIVLRHLALVQQRKDLGDQAAG